MGCMTTGNDAQNQHALPVLQQAGSKPGAVTSCQGCGGVCCREVPVPPYLDDIDFIPVELQREVMEAQKHEAEWLAQGRPCIWWEPATGMCRHHDIRPNVCREYVIGEDLCLETREKWKVASRSLED